ncbi:MAG: hypothetical protein KatS3mg102_0832 [Planctomycetota bacterium]|nr:MAG: hypothetical protein KatS3mg102_0832 [Planctomycetota bacterium]
MSEPPLRERVTRGGLIAIAGNLCIKALSLATLLAVGRFLSVEGYGAAALALTIHGVSDAVTGLALSSALLRQQRLEPRTIDVAWTMGAVRGALVGVGLWLAAPVLAALWDAPPEVCRYLRVLAWSFPLIGVANLHLLRYRSELRFGVSIVLENAGPVAGQLFAVLAVALWRDPVGLVAGPVAGAAVAVVLSWAVVRPRPRPRLDLPQARELWRFARVLMVHGVLSYCTINADDLLVAKLLGVGALGLYAFAFRVANAGVTLVVHALYWVLLPAYARLQDDLPRLAAAVCSALGAITALNAAFGLALVLAPAELVLLVGGQARWLPAAPLLVALVPYVLARGANASLAPVLIVRDRPAALTAISALHLALLLPLLLAGVHLGGLLGAAIGMSLAAAAVAGRLVARVRRELQLDWRRLLGALGLPPLLAAAGALAGALFGLLAPPVLDSWLVRLAVGLAVYGGLWEWLCARSGGVLPSLLATARLALGRPGASPASAPAKMPPGGAGG